MNRRFEVPTGPSRISGGRAAASISLLPAWAGFFHSSACQRGVITRLSRPWPQGLQWQVVGTGLCINGDFLTALRSFKENKLNDFNALMDQMCDLATVVAEAEQGDWVDGR